ncbi:putative Fungal-specific transcription factor domain-containing protein [Seiridium cardinale]
MEDTASGNSWASLESRQSHRGAAFRYPLFPEVVRQRMTTELRQSMCNRSVVSLLLQIDGESETTEAGKPLGRDLTLGPFGVFDPRPLPAIKEPSLSSVPDRISSDTISQEPFDNGGDNELPEEIIRQDWPPYTGTLDLDMFIESLGPIMSDDDSPPSERGFNPGAWENTTGLSMSLPAELYSDDLPSMEYADLEMSTNLLDNGVQEEEDSPEEQTQFGLNEEAYIEASQNVPHCESFCVPEDAAHLLRCFKEKVTRAESRIHAKRASPWQILFMPCALETFAELSLFGKTSHARSAVLFAILSVSALQLRLSSRNHTTSTHWFEVGTRHRDRAQFHLREALQTELSGKSQASYKDLLMAMLSCAVMSLYEKPRHLGYFLLDAERLIRLRGLTGKRSFKIRLLHHMYTYLRIMAESTGNCAELRNCRQGQDSLTSSPTVMLRGFQVAEDSLMLGLDPSSEKSGDIGYNDIHLEVQGRWKESLYANIYGIPESLMTLLSQTIAFANDKGRLEKVAQRDEKVAAALASHTKILETSLWSWKISDPLVPPDTLPSPGHEQEDAQDLLDQPKMRNMISAMHQAIIIYFYRRIHNVNAMMLQDMVKRTLDYLQPCVQEDMEDPDFAASLAWSSFVAACEAVSPELQERALQSLRVIEASATVFSSEPASQVVAAVWAQRACTGDLTCSWSDVMLSTI